MERKLTREVNIGGLKMGGTNPVIIQSMCNTDTRDVAATVKQILALEEAGCELVRVAIPDMVAADGSTVFQVYFDREYFSINFFLNSLNAIAGSRVVPDFEITFTEKS